MTARPLKRPRDQCLYEYPTDTDNVIPDLFYSDHNHFTNVSMFSNNSLYPIPEDNCYTSFPNAGLAGVPPVAYDTAVPSMTFGVDLNVDTPSFPSNFLSFGPVTARFVYLHSSYQALQVPPQSATLNSFSQSDYDQPHGSRSNTSMEILSAHGRSVGSEYLIDSPYDIGQPGVMTPRTAQSFDLFDGLSETECTPNGLLAHENDLVGVGVGRNPGVELFQNAPFEIKTTREHSGSPSLIFLEGIDASSGMQTFAPNQYNNRFPNDNPGPWIPLAPVLLATDRVNTPNNYDFWTPPILGSTPQQDQSPLQTQPDVNPGQLGESSNFREPVYKSPQGTLPTSSESSKSPPPNEPLNRIKMRAAGRRKGPLKEATKGDAKKTREVHACWYCKMRKVTCTSDTSGDCPECEKFWRSRQGGPFLHKRLCIRTTLEDLEQAFIPEFMVQQFKSTWMDSLTSNLIGKNGWLDRGKTEIRLFCGFEPPLIVKDVQEFRPNGWVESFRGGPDKPGGIRLVQTLPLGISQANFWEENNVLTDFEEHLDKVISDRTHLFGFANRVLKSNGYNQSSQIVNEILQWYWEQRESMSKDGKSLLRNAIKVIMITEIFGRRLILRDIPQQFDKFFNEAPYTSRNYSRHRQSPGLINLQVKAALRVLQQKLLSKVLKDFGRELTKADGWPVCFATATILAFLLEHVHARSVLHYRSNEASQPLERKGVWRQGSEEAIREYKTGALVRVFDVIHVLMRCKSDKQVPNKKRAKKIGSMGSSVITALKNLIQRIDVEHQYPQTQPRLRDGEEPCRLVSALVDLIQ